MATLYANLVSRRGRCLLAATVTVGAMGLSVAPALANVAWHITMTHANPYGRLGAKDPYTANEGTFARESSANEYTVTVKNEGTEASQGVVRVRDELPAGMTLAEPLSGEPVKFIGSDKGVWQCPGGEGPHEEYAAGKVTCTTETSLSPGESAPPITIEVAVGAEAAPPVASVATLTNTATVEGGVEGGGAPPQAATTPEEGETTITPAVPFGIESFAVHVGQFDLAPAEELEFEETWKIRELNSSAVFTPFAQAGGHPFSQTTDLGLKQDPFIENGDTDPVEGNETLERLNLEPAGGQAKEVQVEVPPGFVANVLSIPRCPMKSLIGGACPPSTAVGFTGTALEVESFVHGAEPEEVEKLGKVELIPRLSGRLQFFANASNARERELLNQKVVGALPDRGLVYNMQPTDGNPAEFGFAVAGLPILLEVKLHSDGNYGVTVGDKAVGDNWSATDTTFCNYGAEVTTIPGVTDPAYFKCKPETAGAKPLLDNPSQCSTPEWAAHASSWAEPGNLSSRLAHVNVEAARETRATHEVLNEGTAGELVETDTAASHLTGCEKLQFDPEIAFGPSPAAEGGTHQADSPTGATLELTLPQAPEEPNADVTPELRNIEMVLPEGMTASPSAAGGLEACRSSQFWPGGETREPAVAAECPHASQLGTVEVFSPLVSGAPTIEGPTDGSAVCTQGTWSRGTWDLTGAEIANEKLTFSRQWLRNGVPIPGAEGETYSVGEKGSARFSENVGTEIQCEVTASNVSGSSVAVSQPVTLTEPSAQPPLVAGTGNLSTKPRGTAAVGVSLTCGEGQLWTGSPTFKYQWLRDGVEIGGATSMAYTLVGEDAGKAIQCQVTGTNAKGSSAYLTPAVLVSPGPSPAPPTPPLEVGGASLTALQLGGTGSVEDVMTCPASAWTGGPTFSYRWLRSGVPIAGATSSQYTLVHEDEGKAIQCQVIGTNEGGVEVDDSAATVVGRVSPFPPARIAVPSGTPAIGDALTCKSGRWGGNPALFTYRWLRDGLPIAGATASQYTLLPEDEGKAIQCQVTGTIGSREAIAVSAALILQPVSSVPIPVSGGALQGNVFQGQPECSPCTAADAEEGKLLPLFMEAEDPPAGLIVKLHGVTKANKETGQLTSVFTEQPEQPFELLKLKLKGGPRAPLANPQTCGQSAETVAHTQPWSFPPAAGESDIEKPEWTTTSSFNVEGCGASMPFSPSFNAGTIGPTAATADAYTDFSLTFGREDREQDLEGVTVHMPLGLVGKVAGVQQCGQAEISAAENNAGECPSGSKIGEATTLAGPGPDPFPTTGNVYFTGPTQLKNGLKGPFGLVVVTHAEAGPFNLGNVVVRSVINIDPNTAAVTVTSDPLPQIVSGIPIRLRKVNVTVTRPGFMLNPTNCNAQRVSTSLTAHQGAAAVVSSPFGISGCKSLAFAPTFTATTQANSSKTDGASLDVKITYPPGYYANIGKSVTELPTALPSRLTTLQKACPDTTFNVNPAMCSPESVVGQAIAHTPLLSQPLAGPAYLVSHGGAKYPDLEIILQGEGVEVVLDGQTEISKGITKTSFESVPDSPVDTFELNLPEGPHSALGANGDLCTEPLNLPTVLTGQNGSVMKQITKIAVTGCPPTFEITKVKLSGNALLVTVKQSAAGTVKIAGTGLKTTIKKNLKAGTHQIRVALTKKGRSLRSHHKKASVRGSLTVGKQAVAKSTSVKL